MKRSELARQKACEREKEDLMRKFRLSYIDEAKWHDIDNFKSYLKKNGFLNYSISIPLKVYKIRALILCSRVSDFWPHFYFIFSQCLMLLNFI